MEEDAILAQIDERLRRIETMLWSQKEVLTLEEAAMYTGYSKAHLYRLTSGRQIPHFKRSRRVMFNRHELDGWLMENPVRTDDEIGRAADTYCATHKFKR